MVEKRLSPLAAKYNYSEVDLESNIIWKPVVLVLGNYSSGKSTLINELVGGNIQETGQAPTDDSFTVITSDDSVGTAKGHSTSQAASARYGKVEISENRDGKVLLNDGQYPFEVLKKQGDRFAAHFRLKRVNSELLRNLAIIDTPGMLDSVSERDRGYDYQQVVGDLAQMADLILVLFDPHKAGTVRETYLSLRETLPSKTFEDRVVFVLNRIDECNGIQDLLKVYGTLCWNLSQMTGRKDIPRILLTYSSTYANARRQEEAPFLGLLENQRDLLRNLILEAPTYRLDHLATFTESNSERLGHLVETIFSFYRKQRNLKMKINALGVLIVLLLGAGAAVYLGDAQPWGELSQEALIAAAAGGSLATYLVWTFLTSQLSRIFYRPRLLKNLHQLTDLSTQARRDSWAAVETVARNFLKHSAKKSSLSSARRDLNKIRGVYERSTGDIRQAINDIDRFPQA